MRLTKRGPHRRPSSTKTKKASSGRLPVERDTGCSTSAWVALATSVLAIRPRSPNPDCEATPGSRVWTGGLASDAPEKPRQCEKPDEREHRIGQHSDLERGDLEARDVGCERQQPRAFFGIDFLVAPAPSAHEAFDVVEDACVFVDEPLHVDGGDEQEVEHERGPPRHEPAR